MPGFERKQAIERSPLTPSVAACEQRLREISDYFFLLNKQQGGYQCYKHARVEHFGKIAYLLQINSYLYRTFGESEFKLRGLQILERLSGQLRSDGDATVFYPGRLHPENASNNAIDCGGITDSLSYWYFHHKDETPLELVQFIERATELVGDTYLATEHPFRKKFTNQMLWAGTGLAAIYKLVHRKERYRDYCVRMIETAFEAQFADGAFPYVAPAFLQNKATMLEKSVGDITEYYHSRHLSFIADIGNKVGYSFSVQQDSALKRAAEFLVALYNPIGEKSIECETKPWYWLSSSNVEFASSPFDIHALSVALSRYSDPLFQHVLNLALANFLRSKDTGGALVSYPGSMNFQCKIFWSAHAAWIVKAIEETGAFWTVNSGNEQFSYDGADSGIYAKNDGRTAFLLRTKRKPLTPIHGCYSAATLIDLRQRIDYSAWSRNYVARKRWSFDAPGEVFVIPLRSMGVGGLIRTFKYVRKAYADYRFGAVLVRSELRGKQAIRALFTIWQIFFRHSFFLLGPWYSSFWPTDSRAKLTNETLMICANIAAANGDTLNEVSFEKKYSFLDSRLDLTIEIRVSRGWYLIRGQQIGKTEGLSIETGHAHLRLFSSYFVLLKPGSILRISETLSD